MHATDCICLSVAMIATHNTLTDPFLYVWSHWRILCNPRSNYWAHHHFENFLKGSLMEQTTLQTADIRIFKSALSNKHTHSPIILERQTALGYRCHLAYVRLNLRMTSCSQDRIMTEFQHLYLHKWIDVTDFNIRFLYCKYGSSVVLHILVDLRLRCR